MHTEIRTRLSWFEGCYANQYAIATFLNIMMSKYDMFLPFVKFQSFQKLGQQARN